MLKELKRALHELSKDIAPFKVHLAALESRRDALKAAIEAEEGVSAEVAKHEKKPANPDSPKPEQKPVAPKK